MKGFMKSIFYTGEVIRGNRYKYCVSKDDKQIKLKNRDNTMVYGYMNIYGKIYFIMDEGSIVFLRTDKYNDYEWEGFYEQG